MKKSIFLFFAAILCATLSPTSAATKTIYCKMTYDWWTVGDASGPAAVGAYYWDPNSGPTWPGVRMSPVSGEEGMWFIDIDTDKYAKIIFTRVNSSGNVTDWGAKTADQTIPTDDRNLFTITTSSAVWGDPGCTGTWSTYTPPTPPRYITGTIAGGWNANDVEMTVSDGKYTHTFTGLTTGTEYQFKITDGTWDNSWGYDKLDASYYDIETNSDGNIILTPTQDGDLTITFSNDKITLSGITAPKRYLTGETLIGNWIADAQLMNYANGKHTYTKNLAAGNYAFKVTDGTWNNSWGNGDSNYEFTVSEAGDVTIEYNITDNSINVILPKVDYYITGNSDLVGGEGWKANEVKMTENSGIYTYTFEDLAAEKLYLMKVTNGSWAKNYGYDALENTDAKVENYGGNIAFYLSAVGDVTVEFDLENEKITLTGSFAAIPNVKIYCVNTDGWETVYAYAWDGDNKNAEYPGEDITSQTDGTVNDFNIHYVEFKLGKYANVIFGCGADDCKTGDLTVADHVGKYYYSGTWYNSASDIPAPAAITYVLMGVNGDWTNGIPLTVNPDNADEYVLTDQVIIKATDSIKVVTLTNGVATAWCGNVDSWSNATYTGGGEDNIVLEDGIYTFYFKKNANNIYINQTGYARNVTNTYGTICLPYAAASTTGATFFEVVGKGTENGKPAVYLASVTELEAGVPYIFEKSASQIKVVYIGEKETTAGSANGLVGTFADNTTVPNDAYILYGGEFRTNNDPTKPNKINAYRAYLDLSDVPSGAPQPMPGRRYIGMSVQGENEATGVEDIFSTDAPVKVIENGQLIIIRDGVKYNVQGQKL